MIQLAQSTPQFFGQSFSSSSFSGPNGEVVLNTIYTDTDGKRVINGVNAPTGSLPNIAAPQVKPAVNVQTRPKFPVSSGNKKPANSGAYVHDNSGKYKGN